jgi:FkbM family methyltransferase
LPPRILGRLRVWLLARRLRAFPARVVEHSYGGYRFKIRIADQLGVEWYDHDWEPLPELQFLQRCGLVPGATVFDLGAHHCVVAMMMARIIEGAGRVVAVEANPHNAKIAAENLVLNETRNVSLVHAAIADHDGSVIFSQALNGRIDTPDSDRGAATVASRSIDSLAQEFGPPAVVFLDVEGAEQLALSGARSTLTRRPVVFVEVHAGVGLERLGGSAKEVIHYFPDEAFELFGKAESDAEFRPLVRNTDPLFAGRFYLIAVPRPFGHFSP